MDKKKFIELCLGKLRKEKEITWGEIGDLSDCDFHPDTIRRLGYGIEFLQSYIDEHCIQYNANDEISKLEEKTNNMKIERRKLNDSRASLNRKIAELSRIEELYELFEYELMTREPKCPIKLVDREYDNESEMVVLISDVHFGAEVELPSNIYNEEECINRLNELYDNIIRHGSTHNVSKIHVFLLGDLINGLIHTTTRLENKESVVDQILNFSEILADFVHKLSGNFTEVELYYNEGNHDRVFENKKDNTASDDFGRLLYKYMKLELRDVANVVFNYPICVGEPIVTEICGNKVFASHGDKDSFKDCVAKMSTYVGEIPDYIFLGHYHHVMEEEVNNTYVIVNGSFSGNNEYSTSLRLCSTPMQKVMIFGTKGRICTYDVRLS